MDQSNSKDPNREIAYFRFSLIAPIIQGTFTDASIAAYCRRVTAKPVVRPDGSLFHYQPKTLGKWVALYISQGMEGLMPRARSDKGSVRILSDECILEIYRLKERFPKLDAVQIRLRLIEDGLLPASVSPRTIQRFIKVNDLKIASASGISKHRLAFEEEFFGAMWQADTCYFPHITNERGEKQRSYLLLILDDHSRLIVGARIFFEDNAYNFQQLFKDAVAAYGIPNRLYCDHGSTYDNSQLSFICGSIGTILRHAPVRDGAAKGKAERAFGVLKTRWLNGLDLKQVRSLQSFNLELTEAVRKHNLTVNSATGMAPMQRFLDTRGRIRSPISQEWLDEAFMNRIRRKVRNDATISINNIQFDVPMQFMRQTVEVRFLPDRLDEAYIYDGGFRFYLKMTDKQANSKAKREAWPTVDYSRGGVKDV